MCSENFNFILIGDVEILGLLLNFFCYNEDFRESVEGDVKYEFVDVLIFEVDLYSNLMDGFIK